MKINEPRTNVARNVTMKSVKPLKPKKDKSIDAVIVANIKSRNKKDNIEDHAPDLSPPREANPPAKEPTNQMNIIRIYILGFPN